MKKKVVLEQIVDEAHDSKPSYRVVELHNTTSFDIGQLLSRNEVRSEIVGGREIVIRPRKK